MHPFPRILGAVTLCAAAACSPQSQAPQQATSVPRDTGNMAYPQPLPAGNVNTVRTGQTPGIQPDTGSMALPQALPAGNLSTVRPTPPQ